MVYATIYGDSVCWKLKKMGALICLIYTESASALAAKEA